MKKFKRLLAGLSASAIACSASAFSAFVPIASAADMTAIEMVDDMGLGINLGNTFDCHGCSTTYFGTGWEETNGVKGTGWIGADSWTVNSTETAWGNPVTTHAMIDALKNAGFDSLRIPITWFENSDPETHDINDAYLARIKEVVDYAYDNDMYVIINMHWDWAHASDAQQAYFKAAGKSNAYWLTGGMDALPQFKTMWTEIATYFKDYDSHLVFEDMNEVTFDYDTLNTFNQSFVELVRATGGNNADRLLLLAGANDDLTMTCSDKYIVPDDDKVAVSVHYYYPTPWAVATVSDPNAPGYWGYQGTWGTEQDKQDVYNLFAKMKACFVDRGIPVILGEYGVVTTPEAGKDPDDVVEYLNTIASSALATSGVTSYLWDAGDAGDMKTFSRTSMQFQNENVKNVYTELKTNGSPIEFEYDIKKTTQTSDRATVTLSGGGDYSIDLAPYAAANIKQVILKGTAGAGWGVSFPATNSDGSTRNWTSEAGQTGDDGTAVINIDGVFETDTGDKENYTLTMAGSMNFQQWWGTDGATLESVTLVFDEETTFTDMEISVTAKEKSATDTTESTEATEATEDTENTEATENTEDTSALEMDIAGDANHDGKVNVLDVITVNRVIMGKEEISPQGLVNIDFNKNGKPDSEESLTIMKLALGLITDKDIA